MAPIGTEHAGHRVLVAQLLPAYGAAAPYALLLVLVSLPATWLLSRHARGALA